MFTPLLSVPVVKNYSGFKESQVSCQKGEPTMKDLKAYGFLCASSAECGQRLDKTGKDRRSGRLVGHICEQLPKGLLALPGCSSVRMRATAAIRTSLFLASQVVYLLSLDGESHGEDYL